MPTLYNCRQAGAQYRITKFNSDFNVEASYLCDLHSCECPAGHRPHCRHRGMLPKFIQREHVGDNWFYDHDRGGWVQGWREPPDPVEEPNYPYTEEDCPGHIASENNSKICGWCGLHVDSLRPEEPEPSTYSYVDVPASVPLREGLKYPQASPFPTPTIRRRV